tara:strand:+ start:1014 stop:1193 length:180 start_codon:yes stop_codon:yes gene_type:complete
MKRIKYRIVTDRYLGFEVQVWRWYLPFWLQVGINTFYTEGNAKKFIEKESFEKKVVYTQ